MRFTVLLYVLYWKLKSASRKNKSFQSYISNMRARILIKTADGRRGRLFIFDKGKVSSQAGAGSGFDVALVWSDAATAFRVMASRSDEQTFQAAARGQLKIEGMAYYAQWFSEGVKLVM
jgi:hypothetical protein